MHACKPHKTLHHFPCASLSCWFILDFNNITKFFMQWKNKRNCSTLVKSIHLPINDTSQLQNKKHHVKPITKIQRLNKFNNKRKEPPSLFEKSCIIIIVHCTLVQIVSLPLCWLMKNKRWQTYPSQLILIVHTKQQISISTLIPCHISMITRGKIMLAIKM